jgi:hypothetical protein
MFLSSFEDMRASLFSKQTIDTFVHNGRGVFGSDFGSCAFVIRKAYLPQYLGSFRRLFEKQGSVASNEELEERFHTTKTFLATNVAFSRIPGSPVAYWVSDATRCAFEKSVPLSRFADPRIGMSTCNNSAHVRRWWEVSATNSDLQCVSRTASQSGRKWFAFSKGGEFRKWYGNSLDVVDWQDDGKLLQTQKHPSADRIWAHNFNLEYIFRPAIVWTKVTISTPSFRWISGSHLFDEASALCPIKNEDLAMPILGLLCSKVVTVLLQAINPSINLYPGDLRVLPVLESALTKHQADLVREAVLLARCDWDSLELSWSFERVSALLHPASLVAHSQQSAQLEILTRLTRMKEIEEENNRHFIQVYGLQDELSPEVPDDQITLYRPDREEDIQRLISYAIGCMMGRYSLDEPGLIYAHSGNEGFDPAKYQKFPADEDGIIPLTDFPWFPDDAACRFETFIATAWPGTQEATDQHGLNTDGKTDIPEANPCSVRVPSVATSSLLEENLKFVADSLGPNKTEQPRETIRRYLATGFFKHHLKMYKKRPIYWLFSSGRERAFQCLVYLHRYNEGTLSRMRTEYVIPLQGKIAARIDQLADDIEAAASTSHRSKLTKERDKLVKQQVELQKFDEKLRHYADQRIALDLDDGVKVNYGKFSDPKYGDILAEVKAITGGKDEE